MILNISTHILTLPKKGMQQLRHHQFSVWTLVILILAGVSRSLMTAAREAISYSLVELVLKGIGFALTTLFTAGIIYILAKLFKGKGTFWQTFQACGFSYLPLIFLGPLNLVLALLAFPQGLWLISNAIAAVLNIWSFVLIIIGIKETQSLSIWKTLFVLLAPAILVLILLIIATIGIGISLL